MARLDDQLDAVATMPRGDLVDRWAKLTGRPAPRLSTAMLRLALGYELQAKALGGLSRTASRQLVGMRGDKPGATPVTPGMRLVREWHGTVHVVTSDEAGVLHWNGRPWRSLSEIARAITGTRWSGPAFFGLVTRRAA